MAKRKPTGAAQPSRSDGLSPKQAEFCRQFMVDHNGTQAAVRAGYSAKTANEQAARLLAKDSIKAFVARLTDEKAERTGITADAIMENFKTIAERCMQCRPVLDRRGKAVFVETPNGKSAAAYTFDASGANRANELMGRHLGMFTDNVALIGKMTDDQLLRLLGMTEGKTEAGSG